jgi:hypothetical protein
LSFNDIIPHLCKTANAVGWIAAGFAATQRTTYSQGGVGGDPALENWQDAVKEDPGFADSETPFYIGEPWWRWQPIQT